jgi:hypothetical protein
MTSKEKRLCDIPKSELLKLKSLFNTHEYQPFHKIMVKVIELLRVLPQEVFKIFGSYVDNEKSMINWATILRVMQEEANHKEELRNERIYGHKKIFLRKGNRINLTDPAYNLFGHQYAINFVHGVNFDKKSLVLVILNHNTLVAFDENMEKVEYKAHFRRDYASFVEKQLQMQSNRADEGRKQEVTKKTKVAKNKARSKAYNGSKNAVFANLIGALQGDKGEGKKDTGLWDSGKNIIDIEKWAGIKKDNTIKNSGLIVGNNLLLANQTANRKGDTHLSTSSNSLGDLSDQDDMSSDSALINESLGRTSNKFGLAGAGQKCMHGQAKNSLLGLGLIHEKFNSPSGSHKDCRTCARRDSRRLSRKNSTVKSKQGSFIRRDSSIDVGKTFGQRDSNRSVIERRATSVSNAGYLLESKDQTVGKPQIPSGMAGLGLLGKKPKNQRGLRENIPSAIDETPHNSDLMSLTNANRLSKQIQNRMTTISKIGAVVNHRVSQMPQIGNGKAGTQTQNNSRDKFNYMREFNESSAEKLKITDDVNVSNRSFDVGYGLGHSLDISTHPNTHGGSKSQFPSLDPIRPDQNPELNNNVYVDIFESKLTNSKAPTPNTGPNANGRLLTAHQAQPRVSRKSRTFHNESCDAQIGLTPKFEISRALNAKHHTNANSHRSNSKRGSLAQITNNLGSNSRSGLNDEF